jgi:hypothetical protein
MNFPAILSVIFMLNELNLMSLQYVESDGNYFAMMNESIALRANSSLSSYVDGLIRRSACGSIIRLKVHSGRTFYGFNAPPCVSRSINAPGLKSAGT